MPYYAHTVDNQPPDQWQLLSDHLQNTANMAKEFAERFDCGEFAYITGLLHDLGKYSQEFQQKLLGGNQRVDHSTAGAQEAKNFYTPLLGKIFAYNIAGHHSGLPDYGNDINDRFLQKRLKKEVKNYSAFKEEIELPQPPRVFPIQQLFTNPGFTLAFFVRMLFSCLTDADFLDTENFLSVGSISRGHYPSVSVLNDKLDQYLPTLNAIASTPINAKRLEIQQRCIDFAANKPGMYSLTVPTGGGKTVSSLAFALKHAQQHNLERIIYVIPYTSIIEQNAQKFKEILGTDTVLEHHSNINYDQLFSEESDELNATLRKMKLATENWDIPVVVTTNVQFFESLFANKSSRCRKLHNIAKSVVILDEAQMIPTEFLKPCLYTLSELVLNYGSTVVLCTATQPALHQYLPEKIRLQEIMTDPNDLYQFFRRVHIHKREKLTDELLANELALLDQVLCIVNTKKHALKLYEKLKDEKGTYHLSTLMCPKHRREKLGEIKARLAANRANTNQDVVPCRVISTQLIEAGVDVDFPYVYRSMTGIDSIIQSAGRCNREGKAQCGQVHVFTSLEDYARPRGWLQRTAEVGETIFRHFADVGSLEAIRRYFELLYDVEGGKRLDKQGIIAKLEENGGVAEFDFEEVARRFKLIEDNTYTIIIPYDEDAEKLIQEAKFSPFPAKALRALQPYTVSVYAYQYDQLSKQGALEIVNDMLIILKDESYYSSETGLLIGEDNRASGEAFFV